MNEIGVEMVAENNVTSLESDSQSINKPKDKRAPSDPNHNPIELPSSSTTNQPSTENKNIPVAIALDIYEAIKRMTKLAFVPLFGAAYSRFEVAGNFSRRNRTKYERYGIFNADDGKYNLTSSPLLYIVKVNDRQYKESECSFCWCCCCDPVKVIDPPSWQIIDAQTNEVLMTVSREPDGAEQFLSTIPSNPPIKIYSDRRTNCFRGDCRNCGCDCCCPIVIVFSSFRTTPGGELYGKKYTSVYGTVAIERDEKVIYNNKFENPQLCFTKISCCDNDNCCGFCEKPEEDPIYFPSIRWRDPDSFLCCHCECLSNCCRSCFPIPIVESSRIVQFNGYEGREIVDITRTEVTPYKQTDTEFVANAEIVEFSKNNNIPFEEKIAVILGKIIPHSDDPYDKEKIPCYICSKAF